MMWDENNGDRKAILALAQPELEKKTATTYKPAESIAITKQLVDHLTSMGINVYNREEMIQYLNKHGYNSIQEAFKIDTDYVTDNVSDDEKEEIFTQLKKINRAKRTLIDTGQGIYLTDHSDAEGLYKDKKTGEPKGFQVKLWVDTRDYTIEEINEFKKEIENGNIRDQKSFDKWAKSNLRQQGFDNSDSIVAEVRAANESYDRLYLQTSEGESLGGRNHTSSQEDFGTGWVRNPNSDGTISPRYIKINNNEESFFITPQGEIYGFVAPNGDMYLDETVISPEHPIHEYTHLWDRYVAELNPKLWQTGIDIFKKTSLWNEILNNENYGKKWQTMRGITSDLLDSLIASEVHARLTGERGRKILDQIAKDKGSKDIISKLKQWLLDFWKTIKSAFSPWTDEQLQRLNSLAEKDIDKALKYLSDMALKDFAEGVNPINSGGNIQPIERRRLLTKSGNNLQDNTFVDIDKAIMSGKWSDKALDELENLNTDSYDKILKRFSQEELRGSNENLIQAEAIIQRGERGADRKNTQGYGERAKQQEQQIESWALME